MPLYSTDMNDMKTVVIGAVHHNTLGVIRSLGEADVKKENIQVLLVNTEHNPKNLITASKYVSSDRVAFVDSCDDIVAWLQEHAAIEGKRVVICCSDGAAEAVINGKDKLKNKYAMPDAALNATEIMVKSNQGAIAEACGLEIPVSADFATDEHIQWDIFPCIVKPYKSVMGAGKADIRIIQTKEELTASLKSLEADKIQIQQYVPKEMEFQLIGCSLDAGNNIIIPGFTKIIRQPPNTNTGYLLYSPIEMLNFDLKPVEKFIRRIGYCGLFSVEFIRGKDGKDYFLEINLRNDGNAYCVQSAGVNLPYIWAYYQYHGKLPEVSMAFTEPVYFIPDFNDLKLAFREIGLLPWIKEFIQAQSHSIYNKNDIGPFVFEFWRQCKRVLLHR